MSVGSRWSSSIWKMRCSQVIPASKRRLSKMLTIAEKKLALSSRYFGRGHWGTKDEGL
jgi:hypothetical protein